jgi:hypothetical protein
VPAVRGNHVPEDGLALGSIQVFPGRKSAGTLADVWRAASLPGSGAPQVRATRLEDYAAIRALQRQSAPYLAPCSLRQLESRLHAFPEGQLVATVDGQVVGAAASLIVDWNEYGVDHTWREITGDGYFTTHDPSGRTLYACEAVLDASRRGFGTARLLSQAQRRICRRLNLKRIIATARLPGYAHARDAMPPEHYAMRVIWGEIADPALRFRMAQGFQYCGILHGYQPEDAESGGHAALLAWLNPLYAPPGPGANAASERARKCA